MLNPKQTKYKKSQRGRLKGKIILNKIFKINSINLQSLEPIWLSSKQIEASRRIIAKNIKKYGSFSIKVFPDKPITKKPKETRMGSGKGLVDYWVAVVKPGTILFEIITPNIELGIKIFKMIRYKLPIKTKILINN
jgi:large subunit ribosomal protein L16